MPPTIPPVQNLGKGPVGRAVITPFNFSSNPPAYPTIPPTQALGKGVVYVNPNVGVPI
jgi:hypothetical protein